MIETLDRRGEHVDVAQWGGGVVGGWLAQGVFCVVAGAVGLTRPSDPHHMAARVRFTVTCHEPPSVARLARAAAALAAPR